MITIVTGSGTVCGFCLHIQFKTSGDAIVGVTFDHGIQLVVAGDIMSAPEILRATLVQLTVIGKGFVFHILLTIASCLGVM